MKTIITSLFLLFLYTSSFATKETLYVEFSSDTVKIWNKTELNCCTLIRFDVEVADNKIKLIEVDTAKSWCRCNCNFNLCASLTGLSSGSYIVDVYRSLPIIYQPDSLLYIGLLEFNYPGSLITNSYQSECLNLTKTTLINSPGDSLFVEMSVDTVKIWNIGVEENCAALFKMECALNNTNIIITEIDTSEHVANCICNFNLCASLTGLKPNHYNVDVYRSHPKISGDTSFYIGSIEFDLGLNLSSTVKVKSYQSECLNGTEEEVVYSNSFESPQDTVGWQGYMDFRNDTPINGGNQSAFIAGGCVIPHFWIELGPFEEDGFYILRCWGKNLQNGGMIYLQVGETFNDKVRIGIGDTVWTYYQSVDTLYCPSDEKITLAMFSGGFIPSSMLVDEVDIIKVSPATTNITKDDEAKINSFRLYQNYPNPLNPETKIKYSIPSNIKLQPSNITLKVYDILGNEVATLVNEEKTAGEYEVEMDGSRLTSGIYFYQLKVGNFIETKKMCLIK